MEETLEQFIGRLANYSKEELIDICHNIDQEKHPDKYNAVVKKLEKFPSSEMNLNAGGYSEIKYGGFWKRFWANLIDSFICLVIMLPFLLLVSVNKYLIFLMPVLGLIFVPIYSIYFNTKKGATPGKQFVGLKIFTVDLNKISIREACLRSSGDIVFGSLQIVGMLLGLKAILLGIKSHSGVLMLLTSIKESSTSLFQTANTLENLWFWSEVIVLLFNKKRRAIHDYIAKTVVVVEESLPSKILTKIVN